MIETNSSNAKSSVTGNPYVGPQFFTQAQQDIFTGREREVNDLESLLAARRLVLFYAESGAGKTSLINAGLIPLMKDKHHFEVLPVTRVASSSIIGKKDVNVFVYSLISGINAKGIRGEQIAELRLKDFLLDVAYDNGDCTYVPFEEGDESEQDEEEEVETISAEIRPRALIIDQLEELFTLYGGLSIHEARVDFFRQIAEAMDDDPYLYVLLSMRADYEYQLRPYEHLLPYGLRTRYYMPRMRPESALRAVEKPARLAGRPFEPGVAKELVDRLQRQQRFTSDDEKMTWEKGLTVEPVQLQVVCNQLWESLSETDGDTITMADLETVARKTIRGGGDSAEVLSKFVNSALSNYYEQALHEAIKVAPDTVSEDNLREWFSNQVITKMGTKGFLLRNEEETAGMPEAVVNVLDKHHILRTETRGTNQFVELVHDSFIQPVLTANQKWTRRQMLEKPWIAAAYRWDKRNRPKNELLKGELLENALQEAGDLKSQPVFVQDFLNESSHVESARKIEAEQARANKAESDKAKYKILTILTLLFGSIAVIMAIFAFDTYFKEKSFSIQLGTILDGAITTSSNSTLMRHAKNGLENNQYEQALLLALLALESQDQVDEKTLADVNKLLPEALSSLPPHTILVNTLNAIDMETPKEGYHSNESLPFEGPINHLATGLNPETLQLFFPSGELLHWNPTATNNKLSDNSVLEIERVLAVSPNGLKALVQTETSHENQSALEIITVADLNLPSPNAEINIAAFSNDGSLLAIDWCESHGNDLTENTATCSLLIHETDIKLDHTYRDIQALTFLNNEALLWTDDDGDFFKWDIDESISHKVNAHSLGEEYNITHLLVLPELKAIISGGQRTSIECNKTSETPENCSNGFVQWWTFPEGDADEEIELIGSSVILNNAVNGLAKIAETDQIAVLDQENNLHIWDIAPEHLAEFACEAANRNPTYAEWETFLEPAGFKESDVLICEQYGYAYGYDISFALQAASKCNTALAHDYREKATEDAQDDFSELALPVTFEVLIDELAKQSPNDNFVQTCLDQVEALIQSAEERPPEMEDMKAVIEDIAKWDSPNGDSVASTYEKILNWPRMAQQALLPRISSEISRLCPVLTGEFDEEDSNCRPLMMLQLNPHSVIVNASTDVFHLWPIEAEAGSILSIGVASVDKSQAPSLNLYDRKGYIVPSNNGIDQAGNSNLTVFIPADGFYFVDLTTSSGPVDYTLNFEVIEPPSMEISKENQPENFDAPAILIEPIEDGLVQIKMGKESSDQSYYLKLFNEEGTLINESESMIEEILLAKNKYFLQIIGASSAEYTISSSLTPAHEFEVGESVSESLADVPLLQFEGQAGDLVQLDLREGTTTNIYDINLLDEFGSYLDSGWTSIEAILPSDGVYFIQIEGEDSAEYTLSSSYLEASEIALGDSVEGTTASQPFLAFDGQEGDVIRIELISSSSNFDPYLTLYDESGEILTSDDDSGDGFNGYDALINGYALPKTGRYLIEAGRSGSDIPYTLILQSYAHVVEDYLEALEEDPDYQLDTVDDANILCWFGSLSGFAEEVMPACEEAVSRSDGHPGYSDSRGVARAMTGDYEGAIEDFEVFIDSGNYFTDQTDKRQDWIEALTRCIEEPTSCENPLEDQAVIQDLLFE